MIEPARRDSPVYNIPGGTCVDVLQRALKFSCAKTFCPDCVYAGYCDRSCGFCHDVQGHPFPAPNVSAVVAARRLDVQYNNKEGLPCTSMFAPYSLIGVL